MALIIRLNNDVLPTQDEPSNNELQAEKAAEVIFFPGVRYERWADAQPESSEKDAGDLSAAQPSEPQMRSSVIKRDWLEI